MSRLVLTNFGTLSPGDRLRDAVRMMSSGSRQDFPVVEPGRIVRVLARGELFRALQQQGGQEQSVSAVM